MGVSRGWEKGRPGARGPSALTMATPLSLQQAEPTPRGASRGQVTLRPLQAPPPLAPPSDPVGSSSIGPPSLAYLLVLVTSRWTEKPRRQPISPQCVAGQCGVGGNLLAAGRRQQEPKEHLSLPRREE